MCKSVLKNLQKVDQLLPFFYQYQNISQSLFYINLDVKYQVKNVWEYFTEVFLQGVEIRKVQILENILML